MTLTQMNYIITISETGSLNKAAEALYISQPSLTNAVKELEKELGIIIFNRSGRGVTLTNDGTEFLMYARQIYGQYESVVLPHLATRQCHWRDNRYTRGASTPVLSY